MKQVEDIVLVIITFSESMSTESILAIQCYNMNINYRERWNRERLYQIYARLFCESLDHWTRWNGGRN